MKKKPIERIDCDSCRETYNIKKLNRFSWRYNDKVRTYTTSKVKIIHSGYSYLCTKCLKKTLKNI